MSLILTEQMIQLISICNGHTLNWVIWDELKPESEIKWIKLKEKDYESLLKDIKPPSLPGRKVK